MAAAALRCDGGNNEGGIHNSVFNSLIITLEMIPESNMLAATAVLAEVRMRMRVAVPETPPEELGLVGVTPLLLPPPPTPLQTSPQPPPPPPSSFHPPFRHFSSPCFGLER